jgi:chaperone required for assembly of F1-ATPase
MSLAINKKFFEISGYEAVDNGFSITLDGRKISTQCGNPFVVPNEGLASAIAIEWGNQDTVILPYTMPLTGFCSTTLDIVAEDRNSIIDQLVHYAKSDLLCYRSDDSAELQSLQETCWQPLLDWVEKTYNANLLVTTGVFPIKQPQETIQNLSKKIKDFDDFHITILSSLTKTSGSLVISLCVIGADDAFNASQLDENWQRKKWGEDNEDIIRSKYLYTEILDAVRFLDLVRND